MGETNFIPIKEADRGWYFPSNITSFILCKNQSSPLHIKLHPPMIHLETCVATGAYPNIIPVTLNVLNNKRKYN